MIKTFLKHWIYELCIEQFFNMIFKNFNTIHKIKNIKVGDRFNSIIVVFAVDQELHYYNPEVIEVNNVFFTIEGTRFEERLFIENKKYEIYAGRNYCVSIYINDETVKYIN